MTKTNPSTVNILLLKGDGVGPEVVQQAERVLRFISNAKSTSVSFTFTEALIGGAAIDATGDPFPPETLAACRKANAILLGAVGGPAWPKPINPSDPSAGMTPRPEQGLLALRKELDLFANIRPCTFASDALIAKSPLKEHVVKGVEFTVVRELVGGVYFGERMEEDAHGKAWDTMPYSVPEVTRITRLAAEIAMQSQPPLPIHSIDKANVLATSRLWRRVVTDVLTKEYPTIPLDHHLVDSAAMLIVRNPRALNGIVLTENLFGDILSDEASVIPGSLGLLPSASLAGLPGAAGTVAAKVAVYEPIHGSAPDIAGKGIANPIGTILSAAMLLRYSLGLPREADVVEKAVRNVLDEESEGGKGLRTKDLGGEATTVMMGDAVLAENEKSSVSRGALVASIS